MFIEVVNKGQIIESCEEWINNFSIQQKGMNYEMPNPIAFLSEEYVKIKDIHEWLKEIRRFSAPNTTIKFDWLEKDLASKLKRVK